MTEKNEVLDGVYLNSLDEGSVIDLETKSRHYRLEYVGENKAWISGHPRFCPQPVLAKVEGSTGNHAIEPGFLGHGMHVVFQRLEDKVPITTSEVTGIRLVGHV